MQNLQNGKGEANVSTNIVATLCKFIVVAARWKTNPWIVLNSEAIFVEIFMHESYFVSIHWRFFTHTSGFRWNLSCSRVKTFLLNSFFLQFTGPESRTWEEMPCVRQGRLSNGASQSGKEVLAQELLPLFGVQQAIKVSLPFGWSMRLGACSAQLIWIH